ncbi:MAG: RluA family pseudouridine synthase [Bacteriovoracaceae bacterium]|nr:RluA family pseudouridine synthase [Bacteriovoracaceae bacterium]
MSQVFKSFGSDKYEIIYPVLPEHDGLRLDQFLMPYFATFSRETLKKKIQSGEVRILKRPFPHRPSVKVYHGEQIQVVTHNYGLEDEFWNGHKIRFDKPEILFENKDVFVINKPPFMATHPTGKHLFNCATVFYEQIYGHTIHSVHRLDRETSGCLILGKNPAATNTFTNYFENAEVRKCYLLIAHKYQDVTFPLTAEENLGQKEGFIPRTFTHAFPKDSGEGKVAKTYFEMLFENDRYYIALAFPKTGRQHQIRAHAYTHGFPLIGDKLYGKDPSVFMRFKDGNPTLADHQQMQIPRHGLHAISLYFPKTKLAPFYCPISTDILNWIEANFYLSEEDVLGKARAVIDKNFGL